MDTTRFFRGAVPLLAIALAACAAPAAPDRMAAPAARAADVAAASPLRQAIAVGPVGGGEETDPMWTSEVGNAEFRQALELSLERRGYLSRDPGEARFRLEAFLVELKQPRSGYTLHVASYVRYKLLRAADDAVMIDELISGSAKATLGDSLVGIKRLQIANEKAMRNNIAAFLLRLRAFEPPAKSADRPAARPALALR